MKRVQVKDFAIGDGEALAVVCGPCVIESEDHCMLCAQTLAETFSHHWMNFIFKASYDKANRSSIKSFRGPGMEEGLRILQKVKEEFNVPVLTDVHTPEEVRAAAEVCDVLQIPAFLCRQTDLIVAAAKTGKPLQIKKGQFLAPWDMENIINKALASGNSQLILTERGTTFGYNNLVVDFRSLPIMKKFGYPVCLDVTHSLQLPGGLGDRTGGQREFGPMLAKLGLTAGANVLYMEAHPDPDKAKSDATTMISFRELPKILTELDQIYALISNW
ncbi:MAG: 3-deoxy-8-phosphooctulonate synthase [Chlamydiales bacterium]|nr:3-deoxy-8-phosphooctulonate synthase [Chlamydiales bacterium]